MKITKKQLKQIIKEEMTTVIDESLEQKVNRKVLSLRKKAALKRLERAEDANLHKTDPDKFAEIEANYRKLVKAWQAAGARAQIQRAAAAGSDVVENITEATGPNPEQQKVLDLISQAAGLMEDAWHKANRTQDPDLLKHISSMANEMQRQFAINTEKPGEEL